MNKRYKETRSEDLPGFQGGRRVETRVIEIGKDETPPEGAIETTEPVRDWTEEKTGGRG